MKIALIILGIIILAVIVFLFYMGMFSGVLIETREMGPYTFAYVEHIGPYSGVGEPMTKLDEEMRGAGFNSVNGIGVYYDDPKKTPKEELRSEVGSIITNEDMDKIEANKDKFNFKTMERKNYLVAEFLIKNMLSYMFGPMKIYPAFGKYLEEKNILVPEKGIELYNMENNKIIFMMELD